MLLGAPIFGCASNVAFAKPCLGFSLKAFTVASVHWIGILPLFDLLSKLFNGAMIFAASSTKRLYKLTIFRNFECAYNVWLRKIPDGLNEFNYRFNPVLINSIAQEGNFFGAFRWIYHDIILT